jgi:hypothetical protein
VAGGVSGPLSQSPKRMEAFAPELEKIIPRSEPIQELAKGFGGPLGARIGASLVEGRPLLAV